MTLQMVLYLKKGQLLWGERRDFLKGSVFFFECVDGS